MTAPFLGQICNFGGNFNPPGCAFCDGQLLAISQNTSLFAILGTIYGGDGETTFALPDMRGRLPMNHGTGPGLSPRQIGQRGGTEKVTLIVNQLPAHKHSQQGSTDQALTNAPAGKVTADAELNIYSDSAPTDAMSTEAIADAGGDEPHTNLLPFLVVNFIIALQGVFPSRN